VNAIVFCFLFAIQFSGVVALYIATAALLFFFYSSFIPGYWYDDAIGDAQGLWLMAIAWDRVFGPSAKVLRGVAKALKEAKSKRAN